MVLIHTHEVDNNFNPYLDDCYRWLIFSEIFSFFLNIYLAQYYYPINYSIARFHFNGYWINEPAKVIKHWYSIY